MTVGKLASIVEAIEHWQFTHEQWEAGLNDRGYIADMERDARVREAAPDMLAVLIEVIRLATSRDISDEEWDATIDRGSKIIAAIRRAEGK
jgi:hypothetical protein